MRFRFYTIHIALALIIGLMPAICGCNVQQETVVYWEEGQEPDAICVALQHKAKDIGITSDLVYIEYKRIVATDNWFVARIDWEKSWWGTFEVFRWADGQIAEEATFEPPQLDVNGQSIYKIGSFCLDEQNGPVVYVIGTTHQGNKTLFLWMLNSNDATMAPLCQARIRLNFNFQHYKLDWILRDENSDGHSDLVMTGQLTEQNFREDGSLTDPVTSDVRKVFLYQPDTDRFSLSLHHSTGIRSWDDFDTGYTAPDTGK